MKNIFKTKPLNNGVIYIDERSQQNGRLQNLSDMKKIILRERARSDRQNHEFSIILIDIDNFDQENGVLDHFVRLLGSRLRMIDEIGWYDKNQIAIVLPYTTSEDAAQVAEDVTKMINADVPAQLSKILSYPSIWPFKK
ncbi:diguanylate cyclase [Thermodesulfobacteriota bacterium]